MMKWKKTPWPSSASSQATSPFEQEKSAATEAGTGGGANGMAPVFPCVGLSRQALTSITLTPAWQRSSSA